MIKEGIIIMEDGTEERIKKVRCNVLHWNGTDGICDKSAGNSGNQ